MFQRIAKPFRISIHALLAESDIDKIPYQRQIDQFLSTLSLRRATQPGKSNKLTGLFLSTLSLRRATPQCVISFNGKAYFYPRSPCGERHIMTTTICIASKFLSTLSLRRATTNLDKFHKDLTFLSTLSLRRATIISPHSTPDNGNFYPRSPCGERQLRKCCFRRSSNFYPRSPCGERPYTNK